MDGAVEERTRDDACGLIIDRRATDQQPMSNLRAMKENEMNASNFGLGRNPPASGTRLENVGFGSTVFAMALAAIAVLGPPAVSDLGTHLAGFADSCGLLLAHVGHAAGDAVSHAFGFAA